MAATAFVQSPGPLGQLFESSGTSHAAKIPISGYLVTTSGQPGFDLQSGQLVTTTIRDEIKACFACLEAALKTAGVEAGLHAVHKITSYLLDVRHEPIMMEVWRQLVPGHRPTWTTVGVASLAVPGMHIEMQAEAIISG